MPEGGPVYKPRSFKNEKMLQPFPFPYQTYQNSLYNGLASNAQEAPFWENPKPLAADATCNYCVKKIQKQNRKIF